jgi:hypothetical protein
MSDLSPVVSGRAASANKFRGLLQKRIQLMRVAESKIPVDPRSSIVAVVVSDLWAYTRGLEKRGHDPGGEILYHRIPSVKTHRRCVSEHLSIDVVGRDLDGLEILLSGRKLTDI